MLSIDQFGGEFQRRLIRLCMVDPQTNYLVRRYAKNGKVRWTDPAAAWVWTMLEAGETVSPLRIEVEAASLPAEHPARIHALSIAQMATDWRDDEFVRAKIVEWARQTAFLVAQHASVDAWTRGDREEAYRLTMEFAQEVNNLNIGAADRGWFFEEFDERQARRRLSDAEDVFPSGIVALDRAMNGGLRKGEIEIPVAYSGIGKTFWCVHRGSSACYARKRVLHFVLEGGRAKTEDRYEARFLDALYHRVKHGDLDAEQYNRMQEHAQMMKQALVLRGVGDLKDGWSADLAFVYAELEFLRKSHGWVPEMIIVDYGDLLAEKGDNEYQQQKRAYRGLKHLSERIDFPGHRGYAVVSPSQAQRPTKGADDKEHVVRPRDIADSYEKVRVADIILSLNRTNDEKEDGKARVHLAKYRDAEDGLTVKVTTDYARGGFVNLEEQDDLGNGYVPPPAPDSLPPPPPPFLTPPPAPPIP